MNIRITELTDSRDSVNKWMERYIETARLFGMRYVTVYPPRPFDTTLLNYNWTLFTYDNPLVLLNPSPTDGRGRQEVSRHV